MPNAREFDRNEWFGKIKQNVDTKKVFDLTLRPNGAKIGEVMSFLGKGYSSQHVEGNVYRIAVKRNESRIRRV